MPNDDSAFEKNILPELEVALALLEKAEQDLIVVNKWSSDTDISDEIVGFHTQQAIEKSLRPITWLTRSGFGPVPW